MLFANKSGPQAREQIIRHSLTTERPGWPQSVPLLDRVTWSNYYKECSICEFACPIEQSDEFVGYDSACQHIVAALEVAACILTNNVRFMRRWRASGANISESVFVDTLSLDQQIDRKEVVTRVLDFRS